MRHPLRLAAAAVAAFPASAHAHAFSAGQDSYNQFLEGAAVPLADAALLLSLIAFGLMAGLWRSDGLARLWPAFLAGQVAGVLAAPWGGPWIVPVAIALGVVCAVSAALLGGVARGTGAPLAVVVGLSAAMVGLEGHGLLELPVAMYLGILFGINLLAAIFAGLVVISRQEVPAAWVPLGWRILASWVGAMSLMYLAFTLTGTGTS